MKLDDIFDLNGEDDVMLASNGLREASFDVQTSLSSLFPSCGLDTQMGNEIGKLMTSECVYFILSIVEVSLFFDFFRSS